MVIFADACDTDSEFCKVFKIFPKKFNNMKKAILISITYFSLAFSNQVLAQLSLVADGSSDFSAHEKYCSKIVDITQDTADNLAESLQVSSRSVDFRGGRLLSSSVCCVTMDTPKGPIRKLAWQFYKDKKGKIIVRINTINVKYSDPSCG